MKEHVTSSVQWTVGRVAARLAAVIALTLGLALATAPAGASGRAAPLVAPTVLFVENVGQFDARARFQVRGGTGTLWLAEDALWIMVLEPAAVSGQPSAHTAGKISDSPTQNLKSQIQNPRRGVNLKLTFPGANPHSRLEPFDRLETVVSYFLGNDPERWRANVPVWGGVRYVDLYPGVDLVIETSTQPVRERLPQLPLSWHLEARDSIELPAVRLRVEGVETLSVHNDAMHFATAVGDFTLLLPAADFPFQVECIAANGSHRFMIPPRSPMAEPIHPQRLAILRQDSPDDLQYATFLGGSSYDEGFDIAADEAGNVYVIGRTWSPEFPTTPGAFDPSCGIDGSCDYDGTFHLTDVFVAKLNADGTRLLYATFLGGNARDGGFGIAVDGAGNAHMTGHTYSSDFPTLPGAPNAIYNGYSNAFVAKLNTNGTELIYATVLGGSLDDWGAAITVDEAGNAFVTGHTGGRGFPTTPGAFDPHGRDDAFLLKLDACGTGLLFATFLGGGGVDEGSDVAIDGMGNVYVTGQTSSGDFPTTPGAFDPYLNGIDIFVVKMNADGSRLLYGTLLGGRSYEWSPAIAVDGTGSAYVTGVTESPDFPTMSGAFDSSCGTDGNCNFDGNFDIPDSFVARFNADGTELIYSTFLGGSGEDRGYGIATDEMGNVYVTGYTESADFPTTPGAFDTSYNGMGDIFVVKPNADGTGLLYATFLGGTTMDKGWGLPHGGITADRMGDVFMTGDTYGGDFPTTLGAFDTSHNGHFDAFVAKLAVGMHPLQAFHAISQPIIDGDISDWGSINAAFLRDDIAEFHAGAQPHPDPADLSVSLRAAWDSTYLYFAARIGDETLVGNESSDLWKDDTLGLGLQIGGHTRQFTLGVDGRRRQLVDGMDYFTPALTYVTRTAESGWHLEVAIPVSELGVASLTADQAFPFTFGYWDDDDGGSWDSQLIRWGESTSSGPDRWGQLTLSGQEFPFQPTPTSTPSPTPTSTPTTTPTSARFRQWLPLLRE